MKRETFQTVYLILKNLTLGLNIHQLFNEKKIKMIKFKKSNLQAKGCYQNLLSCLGCIFVLLGPYAAQSRGDFVLYDSEQITVNSHHDRGYLFGESRAFIVDGGSVNWFYASSYSSVNISGGTMNSVDMLYSSTANISGGSISSYFHTYNYSTTNISGGSIYGLYALDSSTMNISGGDISYIDAYYSSNSNISGGNIDSLYAKGSSLITFYGKNFILAAGLSLDGHRVVGVGMLYGEWMNGTQWSVHIQENSPTSTILIIPEPATILLLGLGALFLRKRK